VGRPALLRLWLDSWDVLCFKLEYCTVIAYRPGTLCEEKPQLRGLESAGVFIQVGGKEERPQGLEGAEVIFEDNGEEQDGPHSLESAQVVLMDGEASQGPHKV
jgi:hypothetical protein